MKLVSFNHKDKDSFGVVADNGIIDLAPYAREVGATLKEALARDSLAAIASMTEAAKATLNWDSVTLLPVVPNPQKILCVGINYLAHLKETGRERPDHPTIFTRFADTQTAHNAAIVRPRASDNLDFEGELAVVMGRTARHVKAEQALDYVAGYSCYNDGSVRDWQRHTPQMTPGKNFPRTGGFGPWLVTTDELRDPSRLSLTTRLNGEVVQQASTSDMVFDIPALIEYCSTFTELGAGDVIITGTTGGVGAYRQPPLWMKAGDVVEVEISRIGTLRNTIVDE
jgi:2-keto-4-pentenoate hydratase/2-oxohepta-3-ene-1,7-dioic acid hydratase in catechol pathway